MNTTTRNLIDTSVTVAALVEALSGLPTSPPSLYLDLEGINISRHGSVSIIQIHVFPQGQTYLTDVHTLGMDAFSTPGANGQTLKGILESDPIPKVFFDVRNDSDALFSHYEIKVAGIYDIQLMELATRDFSKKFVNGLAKCIERAIPLTGSEMRAWKDTKEKGLDLFLPERGGSYEIFNTRPLPEAVFLYCVQDVHFIPKLWQNYNSLLTVAWAGKVRQAVQDRVSLSQTATYIGKGPHKALGPPGWY
ncbi:hypothetical protein VTL71DRAFT_6309 [Oculimacula yallundae]|uniref:3'-5' exonuclease domain-containing protein n=1 Tax=Oculimacula yallundae TaxID=86028 RepID=A0ABR4BWP5_9HELO